MYIRVIKVIVVVSLGPFPFTKQTISTIKITHTNNVYNYMGDNKLDVIFIFSCSYIITIPYGATIGTSKNG